MWRSDITDLDSKSDKRFTKMTAWLAGTVGLGDVTPTPASADASFRRYFRIHGEQNLIVMDAPPPQEDCGPFVRIAGYLESMGLNSPRVIAADLEEGFLLLSDLGSVQYLQELDRNPGNADRLYDDALQALLKMQHEGQAYQGKLPPYDEKLLRFELSLFHDWLCSSLLQLEFSRTEAKAWHDCCDVLVHSALEQERVFVHRDYHSRNLMVTDRDNPGILDFQDAVHGPVTYDLVSLLKDCYVKWPAEKTRTRAMNFYAGLETPARKKLSTDSFLLQFDLMGVQRHLKAAGIFARLLQRDGKPGYMKDVPRTLSYINDLASDLDTMSFLGDLLAEKIMPALEERNRAN